MNKTVVTVTMNEDKNKYAVLFDERALAKCSLGVFNELMRGLRKYIDVYTEYKTNLARYQMAEEFWKVLKEHGPGGIIHGPSPPVYTPNVETYRRNLRVSIKP